jgi:PAS domain S-box-containing protein
MNMKPADFIGKAIHEVFGDEGRSIHEVAVDRALVGTNVLYEWNRTVGSEVHWYQTSLSPLYDDAGEVEGIVGVGRDVTSVKRAESALRESESKYRSLFQDAAVPIWEEDFSEVKRYIEAARASGVTDFRDYFENKPEEVLRCAQAVKIINVNVESLRFFQVGSAEELVKNLPEYFLDESWEVFREEMIALAQGRFRFLSEISIRDLNGGRKELLLRLTIPAESRETFDRVIVSFIDITERSRMDAKLRELSEAVQQSPASIVITDVDGCIQYVNQTFEVVTGYAREEVLGKNPRILKSGHTSAEEYRKMWETIRQGDVWRGEFRNKRKNGELFWEAATITPIRDSKGRITRFLGQKEDITQRKIFEEEIVTSRELLRQLATSIEKAREEERSEIAREVHDELGQLLSAIKMDVSTLLRRGFEEPANVGEMAVSIYDLIDRGIRAVQELAARLRPGILDDLGLVAALEWQAEDFERRTGIPCRAQLPKVEPIVGPDLATAIFRIFQELTTNIGRHAQATAVEVCFEEKDNAVSLQVTDNGIGISPSVVDNSASIGLLGIRERLRPFNGSLEFSTPKSGGTRVTVTIPLGAHLKISHSEPTDFAG